jgi:hypothetical protein
MANRSLKGGILALLELDFRLQREMQQGKGGQGKGAKQATAQGQRKELRKGERQRQVQGAGKSKLAVVALGPSHEQKIRKRPDAHWKGSATCFRKPARALEEACLAGLVGWGGEGSVVATPASRCAAEEKQRELQLLLE